MPNSSRDPSAHFSPRPRNPLRNERPTPSPRSEDIRLEPLPELEWSLAVEDLPRLNGAQSPAALRFGWLHRAPEEQVVELFRRLGAKSSSVAAPWWLPAVVDGELSSRKHACALEDAVHDVLRERPGWDFVPWGQPGESGYWEFTPLQRSAAPLPTTVAMTHRHPGWIDVLPAHEAETPAPVAVNGPVDLRDRVEEIESW